MLEKAVEFLKVCYEKKLWGFISVCVCVCVTFSKALLSSVFTFVLVLKRIMNLVNFL